jgi:hypothetical protein
MPPAIRKSNMISLVIDSRILLVFAHHPSVKRANTVKFHPANPSGREIGATLKVAARIPHAIRPLHSNRLQCPKIPY